METKNEPKTLEEANYREGNICCDYCVHSEVFSPYESTYRCNKFNQVVEGYGVCDCYE